MAPKNSSNKGPKKGPERRLQLMALKNNPKNGHKKMTSKMSLIIFLKNGPIVFLKIASKNSP